MKSAVSIPDCNLERAKRRASQEQRSLSEVHSAALDEDLAGRKRNEVTDVMNPACGEIGGNEDAFLAAAGGRLLAETEW